MDASEINSLVDHLTPKPSIHELGPENKIVSLPDGWKVEDISKYLPPPSRIKQGVELLTLNSLVLYVAEYKGSDTVIFANEPDGTYAAVFDYHNTARGTCDHIAFYACPKSEQWDTWTRTSRSTMNQTSFAQFIEANLVDVIEPAGA